MVLPIIAAVAGGAISAIGSRRAARTQANAAQQASDAQLQATRETNDMLKDFRQEDIQRFAPFYNAGKDALGKYRNALADGFQFDMQMDPGYQFRRDQGMDAVQGSVAARQGLLSGAALKGMERFGQNFASNEFSNAFNRQYGMHNDRLNRLAGLASSGQNAAGMQGAASQNFGTQIGQNTMRGGEAQAQGFANVGNANAAGTVGMTNAFTNMGDQLVGNWQFNRMVDAFKPQDAPASSSPLSVASSGGYAPPAPAMAGAFPGFGGVGGYFPPSTALGFG